MHSVIANKSTDSIRTMLPSTARNITCDTDIKGAITFAGEDVDARTLPTVVPSERGYRSEMGATYANLRKEILAHVPLGMRVIARTPDGRPPAGVPGERSNLAVASVL